MKIPGLNQSITYWGPGTRDGYGGMSYDTPTTLTGRWEDRTQIFINTDGEEKTSKARVFFTTSVELHGYLYKGSSTENSPVDDAWEILDVKSTPSLDGTQTLYTVLL